LDTRRKFNAFAIRLHGPAAGFVLHVNSLYDKLSGNELKKKESKRKPSKRSKKRVQGLSEKKGKWTQEDC
jgi:hypothetical protein